MHSPMASLTYGVANCRIRTLFRRTCSAKIKYKISVLRLQCIVVLAVFLLIKWISTPGFYTWFSPSTYVKITFWSYRLSLHGLVNWHDCQYRPIFCVVWDLVIFLCKVRSSAEFSSIPLVIPQTAKYTLILAWRYSHLQPVIRGFFRRFGYRLTSIFSGEFRKNIIWYFWDT